MIVLTDQQHSELVHLLVKLLTGEHYQLTEVEAALSYLQTDDRVSCPFERWSMSQLANELINAARGSES